MESSYFSLGFRYIRVAKVAIMVISAPSKRFNCSRITNYFHPAKLHFYWASEGNRLLENCLSGNCYGRRTTENGQVCNRPKFPSFKQEIPWCARSQSWTRRDPVPGSVLVVDLSCSFRNGLAFLFRNETCQQTPRKSAALKPKFCCRSKWKLMLFWNSHRKSLNLLFSKQKNALRPK